MLDELVRWFGQWTPLTPITVVSNQSISVGPALSFTAEQGSSNVTPNQTQMTTLTNGGGTQLNWKVKVTYQQGSNWLTAPADGDSGSVDPSPMPTISVNLPVTINIAVMQSLAKGDYNATLTFSDRDGIAPSQTVAVALHITAVPPPTIVMSTLGPIDFGTYPYKTTPINVVPTVTISNGTPDPLSKLNWVAAPATPADGWLSATPNSGNNLPGNSPGTDVSIHADIFTNPLSPGLHTGTLTFSDTSNAADTAQVQFKITVQPPPATINLVPGSHDFGSIPQGRPISPASSSFQLCNPVANSVLTWVATSVGGSTWLTFTPLSPVTPVLGGGACQSFSATVNNLYPVLLSPSPLSRSETIRFTDPADTPQASNVGQATADFTVYLTVANPPCGALTNMCGTVSTAESGARIQNVLELRDVHGQIIQTQTSNGSDDALGHNYVFSNLTQGATYYVSPAVGRNQAASPAQAMDFAPQDGTGNPNFNFTVRGIPAQVTIANETPGTFVLLTPTSCWNQTAPPVIASGAAGYYSSVIGSNSQTTIKVPPGPSYFMSCWKMHNGAYSRTNTICPPTWVNGGNLLNPGQTVSVNSCP